MTNSVRILLADDFEGWRKQVRLLLQSRPEWQIICEVSDCDEAIRKAQELQPELILLDIGFPKQNGIEAARRIRQLSPSSKIVFLSTDNSQDVVQIAMSTGAYGYVYKARASSELLPAIDAVLRGEQYVTSVLKGHKIGDSTGAKARHLHEVLFYSDDAVFLESFARFIAAALEAGDVAIVFVTASHRASLVQKLREQGVDVDTAIREGTCIPVDAVDALAAIMFDDLLDADRFFQVAGDVIRTAAKAGKNEHPRVAVCGECGFLLWVDGNADAAIRLEQLWNQLATTYEIYSLCGYALSDFHSEEDQDVFNGICAEHSAVYSQENN